MPDPNDSHPLPPRSGSLHDGREFKILHSPLRRFRNQQVLQDVRNEAAQAGWILDEKFYDGRLRFKRQTAARAKPSTLVNLSLAEMEDSPGIFERVELLTLSACDTAMSGGNGKEIEGMAFV